MRIGVRGICEGEIRSSSSTTSNTTSNVSCYEDVDAGSTWYERSLAMICH